LGLLATKVGARLVREMSDSGDRRSRLQRAASELRHAPTRLVPLELAERIQHAIVRVETLLASPQLDDGLADTLVEAARQLLAECTALLPKP
jgi:hypothetical protein